MKKLLLWLLLTGIFLSQSAFFVSAQIVPDSQTPTTAPTLNPQNPRPTIDPLSSTQPTVDPTTQSPGQTTPPNQPAPAVRVANCDVCGFCDGSKVPGRWESCVKCVYPGLEGAVASDKKTLVGVPTPDPFHYYTDLGCISTRPGEFAGQITGLFFSIIGGIAFLFFLYGVGILMTARSEPDRINHGRRVLIGSIVGLLFALFAVFIIRTISSGLGLPLG